MKSTLFLFSFLFILLANNLVAEPTTSFENPAPPAPTESKPDFLYFKKGTFTRAGKNKLAIELELAGKLPSNLSDRKVAFHISFDIDNNKSTGTEPVTFPGYGKDLSAYIIKPEGSNRFDGSSEEVIFQGRKQDIRVSKLKVGDDKVSCELSSELFGKFPSLRMLVMSYQSFTEKGMEVNKTWVDQLPRGGAVKLDEK